MSEDGMNLPLEEAILEHKRTAIEKGRERAIQIARNRSINKFTNEFSNIRSTHSIAAESLATEKTKTPYFQRVKISESKDEASSETKQVCGKLLKAVGLRKKYLFDQPGDDWGGIVPSRYREAEPPTVKDTLTNLVFSTEPLYQPLPKDYELKVNDEGKEVLVKGDNFLDIYLTSEEVEAKTKGFGFDLNKGVYEFTSADSDAFSGLKQPPSLPEYYTDLNNLVKIATEAACNSVTFVRLKLLEKLFELHKILNSDNESLEQKMVPHRDFYNVRKVDTHIHHVAIMNQKHLLRFIKHKLKRYGDEKVCVNKETGDPMTLAEVFESLNLSSYDLSIDTLDMQADNTFHRFDRFNLKYNPIGEAILREIFLKTDNYLKGKYLADISKEVFSDLESNKYVYIEPRISIYGKKIDEFSNLGNWWYKNQLASKNVRFMIQIPRLYSIYKKNNIISNFQELMTNIFKPLFEVTLNPSKDIKLFWFLRNVVAFDCVDDESKRSNKNIAQDLHLSPENWTSDEDPPFSYWIYFIYANLYNLNALRAKLGLNTFAFRPHAGEAGDFENLAATFLCCQSINHGIMLRKSPTLQYLYYLCQTGLAMSPLSNNRLFIDYHANPFPLFFARGMNVSLSTDDPLLLHITKEPLVEEYSCAAQVWRLSSCDTCEIARNSVLQSGFEHPYKSHFLGNDYLEGSNNDNNLDVIDEDFGEENERSLKNGARPFYKSYGNVVEQTNLPDIRVAYRKERLEAEWEFLMSHSS